MVGVGINGRPICEDVATLLAKKQPEVEVEAKKCDDGQYLASISQRGVINCQRIDL
jgi:hypothetical protein